jgi:hypothetical protein
VHPVASLNFIYQNAIGLRPSSGERFAEEELPSFFASMFGRKDSVPPPTERNALMLRKSGFLLAVVATLILAKPI